MDIHVFLKKLFERADAAGFEAYEAYCATGENFEIRVFGGEIINYSVSGSMGLSFRALKGGKMGYASTQVLDEDALELLIEGASDNAQLIENEDEQFIYPGDAAYPEVDAYAPAIDALSSAQKIETARAFEQAALAVDPRIKQVDLCMLMSMGGSKRIVNSKGLDVSFKENAYGVYISVTARDGDAAASGGQMHFTRNPAEVDINVLARDAVVEALDGLAARPVPSGPYKIALKNEVAASLLAAFSSIFSADMAQKGLSLLKGREGTLIGADCLSIIDDPLRASALSASPFDAEGVATARRTIVERGTLNTLLHNLKTAKKQGVATTGHASKGSYASPVAVAPTNFFIKPASDSRDALLRRMQDGLYITELSGLHSGTDSVSGDFSLGAKGYRVTGGVMGEAVNQITIAGNFFKLLNAIEAVGSDLVFDFPGASYYGSPTLLVGELTVAGL